MSQVKQLVAQYIEEVLDVRRDIHANPELAHQEERTAGVVAEKLRSASIPS